ncbi:hypothetical protein [Mycobacterium tuberculosis]|uniref:hypothetical protein n=1 Tax=Mycobacterium tuberculosis TaxID=1773 RepID=UPI00272B8E18|nr:hypothetical protein [Mycobacterium tuberculosis]
MRNLSDPSAWSAVIDAERFFVDLDEGDAIVRLDYRVKGETPDWLTIDREPDRASVIRLSGTPSKSRTVLELTATDRSGNTSVVKEVTVAIDDGRPTIFARPPVEVAVGALHRIPSSRRLRR